MPTRRKPLFELTAADLMSPDLLTLPADMPLRDAGELLARGAVHGAPVVDAAGRCVGVLSASDVSAAPAVAPPPCPKDRVRSVGAACSRNCGPCARPADAQTVRQHMTADPVTVNVGAGIRTVARLLTDAHVRRVVVTDAHDRPVGVVSASDLVAALVNAPADAHEPALTGGVR